MALLLNFNFVLTPITYKQRKGQFRYYTGKPYAGFDERELEIEHGWASEALPDERGSNRYALPKPLRQLSTLLLV